MKALLNSFHLRGHVVKFFFHALSQQSDTVSLFTIIEYSDGHQWRGEGIEGPLVWIKKEK